MWPHQDIFSNYQFFVVVCIESAQGADLRYEVLAALREAKRRPTTFTIWEADLDEYPEGYDGPKPTVHARGGVDESDTRT